MVRHTIVVSVVVAAVDHPIRIEVVLTSIDDLISVAVFGLPREHLAHRWGRVHREQEHPEQVRHLVHLQVHAEAAGRGRHRS